MSEIINVAAYKFVPLVDLPALRDRLLGKAESSLLRGTILLAEEGINLFLAGREAAVDTFIAGLRDDPRFGDLEVKRSRSRNVPFGRLRVKLKPALVPPPGIALDPQDIAAAPRVAPTVLKDWLDAGRDVLLLDTRNRFEVALGAFAGAHDLGLAHFRSFAEAASPRLPEWRERTIVTYCTGGIRCEKAAPAMRKMGFTDVLQLDGGILRYFEEVGADHFKGKCFVFDARVALDSRLQPEVDDGLAHPLETRDGQPISET
jgi:UPF0176 protein